MKVVFVNMTDRFMSGWGRAPGTSYLSIECPSYAVAEAIAKAARERPEMRRVAIADRPRRLRNEGDHLSVKKAEDLGGPWLAYLPEGVLP